MDEVSHARTRGLSALPGCKSLAVALDVPRGDIRNQPQHRVLEVLFLERIVPAQLSLLSLWTLSVPAPSSVPKKATSLRLNAAMNLQHAAGMW